jgi:hypothetical protein
MQEQIDALGTQIGQEAQQVCKRPTKPINGPSGHHIDLTSGNSHHQPIKAWTFVPTLGT